MTGLDLLRQRLNDHVVACDGAMGSELLARLPAGSSLDLAPTQHADLVLAIHLAYLEAGAEVLETATFGCSRPRLARAGAGDLVEAVNERGIKLARDARDAAGIDCLIAGAIGPLAGTLDIDDPEGRQAIASAHAEQAAILASRGAELLVLETFFRVDELELAVAAIRDVTDLPLVGLLSFPGERAAEEINGRVELVRRLDELGLAAAGLNCAPGPTGTLALLQELGGLERTHVAVMPNAGVLVHRNNRLLLPPATPAYLAQFAREAVALGAGMVGGCCGTGPEHVRAMAEAVHGLPAPGRRHSRVALESRPTPPPVPREPTSTLAGSLRAGQFVRVVQLDPPKGTNSTRLVEIARRLRSHGGVDAVDINSNPLARLRMDSLWLAAEIQREVGLETIPHITPRDASLMGLEAQLMGAWRAGIRNLLAITGDPSQLGDYPGVHDVNHVDIFELVRAFSRLAGGFDCAGNPVGDPPALHVGVAVNPSADDPRVELGRLHHKVEAGAHFAMSQVFFSWEPWLRFLDLCGGSPPVPVLVPVWPLPSLRLALRLHHEVPGITVPDELLVQLEAAGADAAKVGWERAARLLEEAPRHAAGAYLIAPFKEPERILELL